MNLTGITQLHAVIDIISQRHLGMECLEVISMTVLSVMDIACSCSQRVAQFPHRPLDFSKGIQAVVARLGQRGSVAGIVVIDVFVTIVSSRREREGLQSVLINYFSEKRRRLAIHIIPVWIPLIIIIAGTSSASFIL